MALSPDQIVDLYCTAWSEPDEANRRQILASVLTPDATYTDPRVHAANPTELSAHIGRILKDRPGAKVLRISAVDMHHDQARFAWHLVMADGTALPAGVDIVDLDESSGKLAKILGFFGPLADMA